jgi:hypothetical protein
MLIIRAATTSKPRAEAINRRFLPALRLRTPEILTDLRGTGCVHQ